MKFADQPPQLPSLEAIAHQAARQFGHVFGQQVLGVESLDALRAQAGSRSAPPDFPAQDTPLQVPPEVERLPHSRTAPSAPELAGRSIARDL